MEIIKFAKMIY